MRTQQLAVRAPAVPRQAIHGGRRPAAGPDSVSVAVLGREAMLRAGVRTLLHAESGLSVVGEAGEAADAAALLLRQPVHVLVVVADAEIDERVLGFLDWVRGRLPECRTVLLTAGSVTDDAIFRVLRAGVRAVVDRAADPAELVAAVHAVVSGDAVLPPRVTSRLLDRLACIDVDHCARAGVLVQSLSAREREVLDLVACGYENARIARALYLSQGAVKAIISRLLTKLRCQNRVQMACIAQAAALLG